VRRVRCPTCRRDTPWTGNPWRPFCSERCKVLDLAAWADERYRIPGESITEEPELQGDEADGGARGAHGERERS
jgi:endogenous inhibitor of DNA gyrase (YacG/DUF329 family)